MTVLVLRTSHMAATVEFFSRLGLTFVEEQHGEGPVHYACEKDGVVLEIYPPRRDGCSSVEFLNQIRD